MPYTVLSCVPGATAALPSILTALRGERGVDSAGGLAAHERHAVAFGERVGVVAAPLGDPSGARAPIVRALRLLAARREAEDLGAEGLLGVAEGEGAAVGGWWRARRPSPQSRRLARRRPPSACST